MTRNVFHVITTISRGGAENQLLTLARHQVKNGNNVYIIYLKGVPELLSEFERSGVHVIDSLAGNSFLKQIKVFSKFDFLPGSIIHAHLPRAELMCYLSRTKSPYVVSRHNSEAFFPKAPKKFSIFLSRKIIGNASKVIAISEAVSNFIKVSGEIRKKDLDKLQVIYYGAEKIDFQTRGQKLTHQGHFVFGSAARLTEQKDIPTLLRGFKILLKTYPDSRLKIAGDGPLKAQLVDFSSKLRIESKVDWLGAVSDMDAFYSSINCFILSSKYEGFGLVLLEALEYSLPIVATRTTSIPEVIGNGGILFEVGNPYDLAQCVRKAVGTKFEKAIQLNSASALTKFSIESTTSKINQIYEESVGK